MATASARHILVPTESVAHAFVEAGVDPKCVSTTGLCVELDLLPDRRVNCERRRRRIAGDEPLTIAFFSSGAEPRNHVAALVEGARALARSRHHVLVFAIRGGRMERAVRRLGAQSLELVSYDSRLELDRLTAQRFPILDAVVSPPHERANWTQALGMPFFLVGPDIGPFAPRNRALLLVAGVATEIRSCREARELPHRVEELRKSGALLAMSERGCVAQFRGFERSAEILADALSARS